MVDKKTVAFLWLVVPGLLFSEPIPNEQSLSNSNTSSILCNDSDWQQRAEQAQLARFNEKWQRGEVEVDEDEYRRNVLSRASAAVAAEEEGDLQAQIAARVVQLTEELQRNGPMTFTVDEKGHCKPAHSQLDYREKDNETRSFVAPDMQKWLVDSSLKRMPTLLQGIFNYLKLYGKEGRVPSYHRFILVGKPGVGKTTLAHSIAQALGYEVIFIHASELFGKYRNHTAINLRELFAGAKVGSSCKAVIIDELHKLFENHEYKRTDDAANATAFWNQLDELEKQHPNIVVIGTANSVANMPAEIKSRFHGKIITMPLLDRDQQGYVLQEILVHDSSIQLAPSVDDAFTHKLVSRFKRYSLRDVQLLVDAAKMFRYAELDITEPPEQPMIIDRKHFELALKQLDVESREGIYKRIKPFLKELNMNAHTAAELGFVAGLCAGVGRVGIPYLFPNLFQTVRSDIGAKNSVSG